MNPAVRGKCLGQMSRSMCLVCDKGQEASQCTVLACALSDSCRGAEEERLWNQYCLLGEEDQSL